jgi:gluconate 2-dehydrogenase gamma chain
MRFHDDGVSAMRGGGAGGSSDFEGSMMKSRNMNRRRFLQATASAAAALTAGCGATRQKGRFLSESELVTLGAICDQIIPPDQDRGAAWAGAPTYIDRQLAGFYREHRPAYRSGLAEADRRAGGSFAQAGHERQLQVLQEMEKDEETKAFFSLVVSHTMQGFYGNPRHGGNRDYCGWRMLGVTVSPVRGRDQYDFAQGGRS